MAQSQSRTDTVGETTRNLRRSTQKAAALTRKNGKWQSCRIAGEWILITPGGEVAMTGTAEHMRQWAFRMARIVAHESRPF